MAASASLIHVNILKQDVGMLANLSAYQRNLLFQQYLKKEKCREEFLLKESLIKIYYFVLLTFTKVVAFSTT